MFLMLKYSETCIFKSISFLPVDLLHKRPIFFILFTFYFVVLDLFSNEQKYKIKNTTLGISAGGRLGDLFGLLFKLDVIPFQILWIVKYEVESNSLFYYRQKIFFSFLLNPKIEWRICDKENTSVLASF